MKDLVTKEIEEEFAAIPGIELGTAEYQKSVDGITKLMSAQLELKKFRAERRDNANKQKKQDELEALKMELDKQERENRLYLDKKKLELDQKQVELQAKQHKRDKLGMVITTVATVGLGLLGIWVNVWGTTTTLEYEDKGIIPTTFAGREHEKKLFNRK